MTKWFIVAWLTGCGFGCNTESIPVWPAFDTKSDCERVLKEWMTDYRSNTKSPYEGYSGQRRGECIERRGQ